MDLNFNFFPIQAYLNESMAQVVISYDLPFIKGLINYSP